MKSNIPHITAADLRTTYYGENGRIKLVPTVQSHAAWWMRHRLPYHVEGVGLYLRHVGRNLRQIQWQNQ